MTTAETALLLRMVRAVWPETQTNADMVRVWTWAFEDLPYPVVEQALKDWIRTSAFLPKPADLRKTIAAAAVETESWELAWTELSQTIKQYGQAIYAEDRGYLPPYLHPGTGERMAGRPAWPGWSSDDVADAVRSIGYVEAGMTEIENIGTLRAQFRDAFKAIQGRRVRDIQTGRDRSQSDAVPAIEGGARGMQPIGDVLAALRPGGRS